jgi:peptidyl-dipeptidase A
MRSTSRLFERAGIIERGMSMRISCIACVLLVVVALAGCGGTEKFQSEVQAYLDGYNAEFQRLAYESSKAEWASNTMIVEGDTTNSYRTRMANEALARFTGSKENIERATAYLAEKEKLLPLQMKQLQKVLYNAADNPQTVEALVKERIKLEAEQTEKLFGFDFKIDGKSASTNEIDDILKLQTNLDKRRKAWEASKEVGPTLKPGLVELQRLRNETVRALGYPDYFSYQVSDYGMTTDELIALMRELNREIRPLYRELHTYARYELAKQYRVSEVPDMLPADWLPNRWGQDWNTMVTVEGLDLDGILRDKPSEWFTTQGEKFYVSLGMPPLPKSFWELSSLFPLPPDATHKKNNHASAWHMDLANDIRCLMSIEPNAEWYETAHHELGHIYYYVQYSNPDVPIVLREGANRGYHEALGSLMGLAAMQKPFLAGLGVLPADSKTDEMKTLLKEALNYVVFIPWSAGVMTEYEYALYAKELPQDQLNKTWWDLVRKYQGIVPPTERGEEFCDAASKTHITDDAAQYYDYAISYVLLFQFHDHIARNILKQDPHATNYFGNAAVGDFIAKIMRPGASGDWRKMLRDTTGEDMSARAMLAYFERLMDYLKEANEGRKQTLEDI